MWECRHINSDMIDSNIIDSKKTSLKNDYSTTDQSQVINDPLSDEDVDLRELIKKYDIPSPRYTSYPTADRFIESESSDDYLHYLRQRRTVIGPLSLYVHIPFCDNICYYCACNKIVTRDKTLSACYLDSMDIEIALKSPFFSGSRVVKQLHLGGGTPTFLNRAELLRLMHTLAINFNLVDDEDREYAIEVDPRTVSVETISLLVGLGFNRISMGIQDFDEAAQAAINRQQSYATIVELVKAVRDFGFKSLNFDLIYGLPLQSVASMTESINKVIALSPDRISVYNYAHLPDRFSSQRQINRYALPSASVKLLMAQLIQQRLLDAGYCSIGMDHYAKPDDELSLALNEGSLQRNFQGYATSLSTETIAFGVSAISSHSDSYRQNVRELDRYQGLLGEGRLPIGRHLVLSKEDRLRRFIITALACQLRLDFATVKKQYAVDFMSHFQTELEHLKSMEQEGLLVLSNTAITLTTVGRQLIRNICQVFDQYHMAETSRHSKAI